MIGTPKVQRSPASDRPAPAPFVPTGMRRVSWVRIVVDGAGAHCELMGVGHRLPRRRRVSLETALALAATGVPTVVRSTGDVPPGPPVTGEAT